MEEDSKIIAKMLTNQVFNLNKEHNDKRDVPIDEGILLKIIQRCIVLINSCIIFVSLKMPTFQTK